MKVKEIYYMGVDLSTQMSIELKAKYNILSNLNNKN